MSEQNTLFTRALRAISESPSELANLFEIKTHHPRDWLAGDRRVSAEHWPKLVKLANDNGFEVTFDDLALELARLKKKANRAKKTPARKSR